MQWDPGDGGGVVLGQGTTEGIAFPQPSDTVGKNLLQFIATELVVSRTKCTLTSK